MGKRKPEYLQLQRETEVVEASTVQSPRFYLPFLHHVIDFTNLDPFDI